MKLSKFAVVGDNRVCKTARLLALSMLGMMYSTCSYCTSPSCRFAAFVFMFQLGMNFYGDLVSLSMKYLRIYI